MYAQRYAGGFVNGDNSRQADAPLFNNIEAALLALFGVAPATNGALVWDGTKFTAASLLKNAQIDPAAAIDKSKLAALNIADADVAGGAAIAGSKLNLANVITQPTHFAAGSKITTSAYSGGPPASPGDKDIWIATTVEASANRWVFQFDSSWVSDAYKWKFIGGAPLVFFQDATITTTSAAYSLGTAGTGSTAATTYAPTRSGIYQARGSCVANGTTASTFQFGLLMGGSNYNGSVFVWDLGARYAQGFAEQEAVCSSGGNTIGLLIAVSAGTLTAFNRRLVVFPSRII